MLARASLPRKVFIFSTSSLKLVSVERKTQQQTNAPTIIAHLRKQYVVGPGSRARISVEPPQRIGYGRRVGYSDGVRDDSFSARTKARTLT